MICNTYVQFFSNLADPTRLEIIKELRNEDLCVGEIVKKTSFEQSRVSHNLKKLKELGFVVDRKEGKKRIYSLEKKTIHPLLKLIDKHVDTYYAHYCKCTGEEKQKRWGQ